MKLFVLVFVLLSAGEGCPSQQPNDEEDKEVSTETFDVSYGDTLQYDLGFFGDEDRAQIEKRPTQNAMSGFCSKGREPLIYCYTPVIEQPVMDTVVFKLGYGSDGASEPKETKRVRIIFKLNYD